MVVNFNVMVSNIVACNKHWLSCSAVIAKKWQQNYWLFLFHTALLYYCEHGVVDLTGLKSSF